MTDEMQRRADAINEERMRETYAEEIIDRRVMRRLATDGAYRNAANADEQAGREEEITRQEEERFYGGG